MYVTETDTGMYFYHVTKEQKNGRVRAICDAVFSGLKTQIPLSAWGTRTHLRERYCSVCTEVLKEQGHGPPV